MQDRLLNAYLAGTVDEATYQTKSNELKGEAARVEEAMGGLGELSPARRELTVAVFDWSQRATDFWQGSTDAAQRRIFNAVYLNRTLSDVTLVTSLSLRFRGRPFGRQPWFSAWMSWLRASSRLRLSQSQSAKRLPGVARRPTR